MTPVRVLVADTDLDAVSTDTNLADASQDPLTDPGELCCPVEMGSMCSCAALGGSTNQPGGCQTVCDSNPQEWTYSGDENGCVVLHTGSGSCWPPGGDTNRADLRDSDTDAGDVSLDSVGDSDVETDTTSPDTGCECPEAPVGTEGNRHHVYIGRNYIEAV